MHIRPSWMHRKAEKAPPKEKHHEDVVPVPDAPPKLDNPTKLEPTVTPVSPVSPPPEEPKEATDPEPSPSPAVPDQQSSTVAPSPLGPGLANNEELQAIWEEINKKVNELAKKAGRPVNKGMGYDDVMGTLASTEHPNIEPGKKDTAKKVFGNTLKVIQRVGGFVADGASNVFPAASQCYNAIGFVITAWQDYESAFDGLTELFDESTKYLTRLEIYSKGDMDKSLSALTAKQLRLFVTVCDHAISLRHTGRGKLKTALKIAFLGDSSIQGLVSEMAKNVGEEHILISAHTYINTKEALDTSRSIMKVSERIEGQMKDLHLAVMQDKEANEQNQTEAVIRKALGYNSNVVAPVWSDRYRDYMKERLSSTGQWVYDDLTFIRWKKGQSGANILAVTGDNGTGKSFLATSVIQHFIQRANPAETIDSRSCAAFYYLEEEEVKDVQTASNIDFVAKSLVWQLTVADARYKRSAAGMCRGNSTADVAAMSQRLLFECQYLHEANGMFYIIIDGLAGKMGEGMLRFLKDVSAATTGGRIRVLITCDSDCYEHLGQVEGVSFESIQIDAKNESDVQAFVESRMDDMPALSDCADASVRELRKRVCDGLIENTKHDYVRIKFALHEIAKQEYPEKIMNVVDNAGRERLKQIQEEIEELERSLADSEILEINEIILWTQHHQGPMTESWLTAALRARDGKKSLLRLSDKFKTKYTLFTTTHRGDVTFRAPEVEKAIPRRHKGRNEPEESTSPNVVSQAEVELINHFLRTVCPPNTYSKLNVDALLAQKQHVKGNARICQDDSHTGQAKLALACLELLIKNANEHEEGLLPYARKFFDHHLGAADLAFVDIDLKVQIGQLLVKLFTDDGSIDALVCTRESSRFSPVRIEMCEKLLLKNDTADTVIQWLRDSAVTSEVSDKETREWISDVIKHGGPGKLLAPAAKRMAWHLVREPHLLPVTRGAFLFLVYYIRKFEIGDENPEEPDPFNVVFDEVKRIRKLNHAEGLDADAGNKRVKDMRHVEEPKRADEIDRIDNWCANVLGIAVDDRDSFWHSQMANMLLACSVMVPALQRARKALEMDENNWRASTLLANKSRPAEGIETIKPVIDRLALDVEWQKDYLNRSEYSNMLFILAEKTWQLSHEKFDDVVEFAIKAIRVEPFNYPRIVMNLSRCAKEKQWGRYMEILDVVVESSKDSEERALSEMIILCIFDMRGGDHIPMMLEAAFHADRLQFLADAFRDCVVKLEARGDRARLCHLRYYYGRVLNALQIGSPKAIDQWRKAIEEGASADLLSSVISNIMPHYLQKAIKAAAANDNETAAIYLENIRTLLPEDVPESSVMLPPAIYIVRYHARKGDLAQAKLFARDVVRKGIEILTDDIEENDLPAYKELLWLFIALGDEENVKAIRSLMAARFNVKEEISSTCGGDCGTSLHLADEMIWCQDCIDIKFEHRCHGKIDETSFPFLFCDASHKFIHLSKVDHSPDGFVLLGDDLVSEEEWMQRMQRDYVDLVR